MCIRCLSLATDLSAKVLPTEKIKGPSVWGVPIVCRTSPLNIFADFGKPNAPMEVPCVACVCANGYDRVLASSKMIAPATLCCGRFQVYAQSTY